MTATKVQVRVHPSSSAKPWYGWGWKGPLEMQNTDPSSHSDKGELQPPERAKSKWSHGVGLAVPFFYFFKFFTSVANFILVLVLFLFLF